MTSNRANNPTWFQLKYAGRFPYSVATECYHKFNLEDEGGDL